MSPEFCIWLLTSTHRRTNSSGVSSTSDADGEGDGADELVADGVGGVVLEEVLPLQADKNGRPQQTSTASRRCTTNDHLPSVWPTLQPHVCVDASGPTVGAGTSGMTCGRLDRWATSPP